jgi:amino-acid N-acetyltransferase
MPGLVLEPAEPRDLAAIRALLVELGLPAGDLGSANQHFIVGREGGALVGCVGLEVHGSAALLRSLAVEPARQGAGVGRALYRRALDEARARGVTALYLLTTTAERYFAREGFQAIGRDRVPAAVRTSAEFGSLCPASAACMWKPI